MALCNEAPYNHDPNLSDTMAELQTDCLILRLEVQNNTRNTDCPT